MRAFIFIFIAAAISTGCIRPYKIDIQQGNVIDTEQISQLKPGMTRREVQYILGTPLVEDPFHADRWDYFYSLKEGRSKNRQQQLVTVVFTSDELTGVEGAPETQDVRAKKTELLSPSDKEKKKSLFKRSLGIFKKKTKS